MGILSHRVTCVYYQTHTKSQSQLCTHKWDNVYYYQTFLFNFGSCAHSDTRTAHHPRVRLLLRQRIAQCLTPHIKHQVQWDVLRLVEKNRLTIAMRPPQGAASRSLLIHAVLGTLGLFVSLPGDESHAHCSCLCYRLVEATGELFVGCSCCLKCT
jgi:hypothetical protein